MEKYNTKTTIKKACTLCGEVKPKTKEYFYKNGKYFKSRCKECMSSLRRKKYLKNKDYYKNKAKKRRDKLRPGKLKQKRQRIDRYLSGGNWKKIKGYDIYWVSDNGDIYSEHSEKILIPTIKENGYVSISLWKNDIGTNFYIHRLVMAYFGSGQEKETVNHIDGNKRNNHISNLEWATQKENNNHAIKNGLRVINLRNHPKISIPVEQRTINGDLIKEFPSMRQAQRETGCDATGIGRSIRKGWVVGGYRWYLKGEYKDEVTQ